MRHETSLRHPDIERGQRLIAPYGGRLVQSFRTGPEGQALLRQLEPKPRLDLTEREFLDLEMLASGAFSPLDGFMDRETYFSVREHQSLPSGLPWGWPVTLSVTDELASELNPGDELGLYFCDLPVGLIEVDEIFQWEPNLEAFTVFDSANLEAPAIAERLDQEKTPLLGGKVTLIVDKAESGWSEDHLWPCVTRSFFEQQNWMRITSMAGVSAWHRADEHVLRNVLDTSDALMLQAVPERQESFNGLSPALMQEARQVVLRNYFPRTRVLDNRLPRHIDCESTRAILQLAIISQNYGCNRIFIDIQSDARWNTVNKKSVQNLLTKASGSGLHINVEFIDPLFYCESCGDFANERSCPHDMSHRQSISNRMLASAAQSGKVLPSHLVRPEISRVLFRRDLHQVDTARLKRSDNLFPHTPEIGRVNREMMAGHKSAVLWMTGLSGSGKSTVAHRLERELVMSGHRVYVLDGDTLRTGLCADLGFSREARQENLRRAAEVAKVMREAGMLVIASFISPFRAERETLVDIVGDGFYEVYIEASLETCEGRDPKGLYKRARAGAIPEFTGISSPYEPPENPAIRICTDNISVEDSAHILMRAIADLGLLRMSKKDLPLRAQHSLTINRNLRVQ
jgi:sulfate adenylyltransferase